LVDPVTINTVEKNLVFNIKGNIIETALFIIARCNSREREEWRPHKDNVHISPPSDLNKMEMSICYAHVHGEKILSPVAYRLIEDCTLESPNAF